MVAAIAAAIGGCVTTGNNVSETEALANYPQTGIEAMVGEWEGTWTGGNSYSTLKVDAEDAQTIEVKYCYGGWCARGCSDDACTGYANKLTGITFENETLTIEVKGRPVTFKRVEGQLHGLFNNKYRARMKRKR